MNTKEQYKDVPNDARIPPREPIQRSVTRLAKTRSHPLARKLGKQNPRSICIEQKISHEELSEMVGTTRPRISEFMQRFRRLGLIEKTTEHFLIIKEKKLTDYLAGVA